MEWSNWLELKGRGRFGWVLSVRFAKPSPCQAGKGRVGIPSAVQGEWSRGPMDRTMASEAVGPGSIPGGTTNLRLVGNQAHVKSVIGFSRFWRSFGETRGSMGFHRDLVL
jgi:hypothetical protein